MIPIIPYPTPDICSSIAPKEWISIHQAFSKLLSLFLHLSDAEFTVEMREDGVPKFLLSYLEQTSCQKTTDFTEEEKELRKKAFLVIHRTLSLGSKDIPNVLLSGEFLLYLANAFPTSATLRRLFLMLWKTSESSLQQGFQQLKAITLKELGLCSSANIDYSRLEKQIHSLAVLFLVSGRCAELFITGSDFVDNLIDVCPSDNSPSPSSSSLRRTALRAVHTAFWQVLNGDEIGKGKGKGKGVERKANYSLLSDHLHQLLLAKLGSKEWSFLVGLVNETALLWTLKEHVHKNPGSDAGQRLEPLAASLQKYRKPGQRIARSRKPKPVDLNAGYPGNMQDVVMQRHIEHVKEVFPELREAWVVQVLEQYGGDVESLVRDILEGKLVEPEEQEDFPSLSSNAGFLPERRNTYDNDELYKLSVPTSKLHIGKRHKNRTADDLLHDSPNPQAKAAIYAALTAFDSGEDERDDTYDQADVGGAVDSSEIPGDPEAGKARQEAAADESEKILWETYQRDKSVFTNNVATKRSDERQTLRKQTGWTDEAIQGWAIMLERDPGRVKRLENKYALGNSIAQGQTEITRTAYRRNPDEEDSATNSGPGFGRGIRAFRGRGWGRGGGGGGEGWSQSQSKTDRARKEHNKARRANHNRKEGAARKMARGGGFPAPL